MSDETGMQGRWDHLLREIPTKSTTQKPLKKQVKKAPAPEPVEPQSEEDHIYKVSDINRAIKKQLEGKFSHLWLQGEISNFKAHTSGHHYFSLKDDKAQISAVMFKGYNSRLKFRPESGMEVLVRGKVTVYEPRGNYQIFCEHMEPVGAGALQKAFEQLKAKLQKEGLFDEDKKQTLPDYPKHIGVVTSPTGAAIQDILNVLGRRSKRANVTVIPARVQGDGAAAEITRGIEKANELNLFDVLIVGRGGGSIEDLWCFNEEIVARAIANSKIPIISAVGHEVDFTIADFVSDLRAPTPSAAAEIVAKSEMELNEKLKFFSKSIRLLMFQKISEAKQKQSLYSKRLVNPKKYVEDSIMKLEDYRQRLIQNFSKNVNQKKLQVVALRKSLVNPMDWVKANSAKVKASHRLMVVTLNNQLQKFRNQLNSQISMMDSLSPLRTVDRGYAIVREKKKLLADVKNLKSDSIEIELRDGFIEAKIEKKKMKEES